MSNEVYLGDGVYVEIDRGMVKLTTREPRIVGDMRYARNTIYLEPTVAAALVDYISELGVVHRDDIEE